MRDWFVNAIKLRISLVRGCIFKTYNVINIGIYEIFIFLSISHLTFFFYQDGTNNSFFVNINVGMTKHFYKRRYHTDGSNSGCKSQLCVAARGVSGGIIGQFGQSLPSTG